ncbi:hypothetical protein LT335_00347 [Spiroplasma sp. JKS002669]|uniref:hypothetical protein n=1 Tax=Spiroplasma attinicola TaxID=2904537 RepID=UPI0020230E39|nr:MULTISPECIES: hypothetical protein [unclassified Spiroplasma]MCL6428799.1 hypothetical protein [Spiroplasma sp. JKS002669]MCL8210207.1 hypothetical protein [Spiroplasma sp. JKS002670]MCL8210714.1 hypothetical protein [Spiroplasma sp. JKS002671]
MKKTLSIWGAAILITSGATAAAIANSVNHNISTTSINALININNKENWKVNAEGPRTTLEKVGGVWRLDLNHELTQDIISGAAKTSDVLEVVSDAIEKIPSLNDKIGSAVNITDAILKLGKPVLKNADKGNGILIRFGAWVAPTKVTESTYDWN